MFEVLLSSFVLFRIHWIYCLTILYCVRDKAKEIIIRVFICFAKTNLRSEKHSSFEKTVL